ncbi:MAG TPA: SAM-dependent methyltransferase [Streptosporangiaceae bacterium]|nr:SAM-dependent methyltransferase [Streptosporangiaceae bacterium]
MADEQWSPAGIDPTKPNVARVYDYLLGGKDNFAADRELGEEILRMVPEARESGVANRGFLRRAVRYMVTEAGVRQFLDIGSGLPTQGNVHEIAQELDPGARVVYVDNDPVVLVHTSALLENHKTTAVIMGDLRRPDEILANETVRGFLDFDQPIGLLMISILHHINDHEDPLGITKTLRDALAPGSHMAITHFHNPGDERPEDAALALASEKQFNERFGTGRWRTREEIRAYFGDFEIVEPGLVPMPAWRPDVGGRRTLSGVFHRTLGGVGRKR